MATGRTVTRWTRFCVDMANGTPAEIPVDSISAIGFAHDEVDVTAYQDSVKGYLSGHPTCEIEITGPFSNLAAVAISGTGVKPALSGSHTVLAPIVGLGTPLGLAVMWGIRGYWAAGDPVFGVVAPDATTGYQCTKYVVEGEKYSARFVPYPGSVPAFGTAILT